MRILNDRLFPLMSVFVALLVFTPFQLASQVIIKEKVEIHPKSPPLVRMQSASSLQIIASWSVSGDIDPLSEPSIGMANLFCQITGAGDMVTTAPAISGGYNISASVSTLGPVQFDLRVEVGGTEVLRQTGVTPANVRFILQPQVVLHSGVAFHGEQQTLIHGEGTGMRLGTPTQHPLDLCAETIWHQKMPTQFTIVQGATLGSFYDTSGTRIGTSVQWTEETVGAIMFVADGDQPAAEGEDVIIEASNITGVLGQTTIRVFPVVETIVVDHFEVTAGTDTLEYGNSTPLAIVAKDAQGREPQGEDQDFLVTLTLEGGEGSPGSFAVTAPSLDTTFIFPGQFAFSYLVYRSGVFSIAYLANGDVPTGSDPATVTIRAVMANNPEVFGEKQVVVRREPECVKIVFADPVITPGDTTELTFRKINADGSETDFPLGQLFDVQILTGGMDKGILLSPTGETGSTLVGSQTPILYRAPETIEGEEMTVQIVALPSSGGGGVQAASMSRSVLKSASSSLALTKVRNRLLALAAAACPINNVTVRVVPDGIDLKVDPDIVHFSEEVSLPTYLLYKSKPLPSGYDDILVNYFLASESEGFGALDSGSGARGSTIIGVSYNKAQEGFIKFVADGQEYNGRFPLGIAIGVGAEVKGNLLVDVEAAYLFGPNTIGVKFDQADPDWKDLLYDSNVEGKTIGSIGCALTCIAVVLKAYGSDTDPKRLNTWMVDHRGFDEKNVLLWATLSRFTGSPIRDVLLKGDGLGENKITKKTNIPPKALPSLSNLDAALAEGKPVIAQVLNPDSDNSHWVVVTGKISNGNYNILDPSGKPRVILGPGTKYPTIYKYVLISTN